MPTPYSGSDAFPASYNIPSGGDQRNAQSVNVALEALGDRTKWLQNRISSALRILDVLSGYWTNDVSGDTPSTSAAFSTSSYVKPGSGHRVDLAVQSGDVLLVDAAFTAELVGANDGILRLYQIHGFGGGSPVELPIAGAKRWLLASTAGFFAVPFSAVVVCSVTGTTRIGIEGKLVSGSGPLRLQGSQSLRVLHLRAN